MHTLEDLSMAGECSKWGLQTLAVLQMEKQLEVIFLGEELLNPSYHAKPVPSLEDNFSVLTDVHRTETFKAF